MKKRTFLFKLANGIDKVCDKGRFVRLFMFPVKFMIVIFAFLFNFLSYALDAFVALGRCSSMAVVDSFVDTKVSLNSSKSIFFHGIILMEMMGGCLSRGPSLYDEEDLYDYKKF